MSATRSSDRLVAHREGADLDSLVAEIASEHPEPVRFLDVDRVRRGGVLGFFAKERYALTYEVAGDDDGVAALPAARHRADDTRPRAVAEPVDLDELLGRADAQDARPTLALVPPLAESARSAADRFADILYGLAGDVVDEAPPATLEAPVLAAVAAPDAAVGGRHRGAPHEFEPTLLTGPLRAVGSRPAEAAAVVVPEPVAALVAPVPVAARPDAVVVPAGSVPVSPVAMVVEDAVVPSPAAGDAVASAVGDAVGVDAVDARLRALGVPAGLGGTTTADPARAALVTALVAMLDAAPPVPALPSAPGDLVLVVGDPATVAVSAAGVAALLAGERCAPRGRSEVRTAVARLRAGDGPGILQLAADDPALADVAAGAELVVVAVEATGKTSDHRRLLDRVAAAGAVVGALAVERVRGTASPASVWELGLPVLTLDGAVADTGRWLGVLLDA